MEKVQKKKIISESGKTLLQKNTIKEVKRVSETFCTHCPKFKNNNHLQNNISNIYNERKHQLNELNIGNKPLNE